MTGGMTLTDAAACATALFGTRLRTGGSMELSIKSQNLNLSDSFKTYAERRLRFALGGFITQLSGIEVRLADVNGPCGGFDKACAITVMLRRHGAVFARAAGDTAYSSVDRAAARIRSAVASAVGRHRSNRRHTRWQRAMPRKATLEERTTPDIDTPST